MHVINCWNCGCSVPIGNDGPQRVPTYSREKVSSSYAWVDKSNPDHVVIAKIAIELISEVRRLEELLLNATPEKDRKCQTCSGHGYIDNKTGHHVCVNCRGTRKV